MKIINKSKLYKGLKLALGMSFFTFALLLIVAGIETDAGDASAKQSDKKQFRTVRNNAFGFGEMLKYKVGYKFITAGIGYFNVRPLPVNKNGRMCFDIRFQVRSLESLGWIYKVKDDYRTMLDFEGVFPWEFEQNVREGNYKRDYKAEFDQAARIARSGNKTIKIPEYVHDIVSAFYYVRTLNLGSMPKDSVFYLKNFFDDSTYTLGVKILGRQVIEVEAGKFRCIAIEPLVVKGGLFQSEGKIVIFLTDDERKIPVKVATKILIGYVSADLVAYSGLKGPLGAKIE